MPPNFRLSTIQNATAVQRQLSEAKSDEPEVVKKVPKPPQTKKDKDLLCRLLKRRTRRPGSKCCARRGCTCQAPDPYAVDLDMQVDDQGTRVGADTDDLGCPSTSSTATMARREQKSLAWSRLHSKLTGERIPLGSRAEDGQWKYRMAQSVVRGFLRQTSDAPSFEVDEAEDVPRSASSKKFSFAGNACWPVCEVQEDEEDDFDVRRASSFRSDKGCMTAAMEKRNSRLPRFSMHDEQLQDSPSRTRGSMRGSSRRNSPALALPSIGIDAGSQEAMSRKMMDAGRGRIKRMQERLHKEKVRQANLKKFEALPADEKEALKKVFEQFDADCSGYLDFQEVAACLQELGLSAQNAQERCQITQVCRDAMRLVRLSNKQPSGREPESPSKGKRSRKFGSSKRQPYTPSSQATDGTSAEMPESARSGGVTLLGRLDDVGLAAKRIASHDTSDESLGLDLASKLTRRASVDTEGLEASSESEGDDYDDDEAGSQKSGCDEVYFDLLTFALYLVPTVRERLMESQSNKILRYFRKFDRADEGSLAVTKCLEIGRCLGLDQRFFVEAFESVGFTVKGASQGVDFETFQRCVMKCRERTERRQREREVELMTATGVKPSMMGEFRKDIHQIYDSFMRFAEDTGYEHVIDFDGVMKALRELGLWPTEPWDRSNIEELLRSRQDLAKDSEPDELKFEEFMIFIREVRLYQSKRREDELFEHFRELDKDHSGSLSMDEISTLLEEMQCLPRNRKEQEEIGRIIHATDADGNGVLDFEEFKELTQRIEERFASLRYEAELSHALECGFTDIQLSEFRSIFEMIDVDGSGKLEAREIRQCLGLMQRKVPADAFDAAFDALDSDSSGDLDFCEFIDFMKMMRDSQGIFAVEEEMQFPRKAMFLEERLMRLLLGKFNFTSSYLRALDRASLLHIFCSSFGIREDEDFQAKLGVTTLEQFAQLAKDKGEESNGHF
eukprot:gb/GFBE01075608.1/.p1 GENE.gb/GFBE01075608.1/~~gb/GFBE01075608.1/.p1  ORF type:complete len:959 (+),score=201.49 gb/GFBE01075608.1/:1-2877(+)